MKNQKSNLYTIVCIPLNFFGKFIMGVFGVTPLFSKKKNNIYFKFERIFNNESDKIVFKRRNL